MLHIVVRDKETYKSYTERERVCILQTKKESCVTGCGCFVFDFVKNLDALERQPLYLIFRLLKKKKKTTFFFGSSPLAPLATSLASSLNFTLHDC